MRKQGTPRGRNRTTEAVKREAVLDLYRQNAVGAFLKEKGYEPVMRGAGGVGESESCSGGVIPDETEGANLRGGGK